MGKYKNGVMDRANKLIKKNRKLNLCKNLQLFIPIVLIGGYILNDFFRTGSYNLNVALTQYEFYILLVVLLIYNMAIQSTIKSLEKEVKGEIDTFRNKMILRICDCKNSCDCKDELNSFMKKNGVKII